MRISVLLVLLVFLPMLALAAVEWHKYGGSDKDTITLGGVTLIVEAQQTTSTGFTGDDLKITARVPYQKPTAYYFTSSYGYGAVAIHGDLLLLKYGVGRGTAGARVEHVKILRLHSDNDDWMDELADVQVQYWFFANPHNAGPDSFEYQLQTKTESGFTTFTFSLPKPHAGFPSKKIVRIQNDG